MPSIHQRHSHATLADTALYIYRQYCKKGAPQEVNLHKGSLDSLKIFESDSYAHTRDEDLFGVFDKAFIEIMDLLKHDTLMRVQLDAQRKLEAMNKRTVGGNPLSRTTPDTTAC